jgi:hypothetical protein
MRWYVSIGGQVHGPLEEQQVVDLVRSGRVDAQVRGEAGGAWLTIQQSPFAGFVSNIAAGPPSFASVPSHVQVPHPGGRASPGMSTTQMVAIVALLVGSFVGLVLSAVHGLFGLLIGLGLILWAVVAELRRRPSLFSFVFARPAGLLMTAGLIAMGLCFSTCGGIMLLGPRAAAEQKRRESEATEQAAQQKAQQRAALEKQLPPKVQAWREKLKSAQATADKGEPAEGHRQAEGVAKEMEDARVALGEPEPAELTTAIKDAKKQADLLKAHADLLAGVAAIDTNITKGKEHAKNREWLEADKAYDAALDLVRVMEKAPDQAKSYLPKDFDAAKKKTEAEKQKRAIAGPVATEKKRLEQEEKKRKEAETYAALCGEAPGIGAWDGEVIGLESALKKTAHDPDSIDVENCTTPVLTGKVCWVFICDVRGKNMFGAMILQRRKFSFSKALGFSEE